MKITVAKSPLASYLKQSSDEANKAHEPITTFYESKQALHEPIIASCEAKQALRESSAKQTLYESI